MVEVKDSGISIDRVKKGDVALDTLTILPCDTYTKLRLQLEVCL